MPRGPNVGVVLAPQQLDRRHWWHLVRGWAQWPVMCRMSHYLACVILTGVRTTVDIPSLIDMLAGGDDSTVAIQVYVSEYHIIETFTDPD